MKFIRTVKRRGAKSFYPRKKLPRYQSIIPRGMQYSIETMQSTIPITYAGTIARHSGTEFPTNLPFQNIIGAQKFPTFEQYKLLSIKVQFIPGAAYWQGPTPNEQNTPAFFGGVHMAAFHTDQHLEDIDYDWINKYKDAKHYNPYSHDKMVCYWIANSADSEEQSFSPLPTAIEGANWAFGGVRIAILCNNVLDPADIQIIGEVQLTYKIALIGKMSVPFSI